MYRRILLCYNGTPDGLAAVEEGADLACSLGAEAHLLAVIRRGAGAAVAEAAAMAPLTPHDESGAQEVLREAIACLRARGLQIHPHLAFGEPVTEIIRTVQRIGADLVVLGHRNRGPLAYWWRSPTSATLIERAPCSILVTLAKDEGGGAQPLR